jgi:HAD superfamily hydrolase (TIGR01548 family)
MKKGKVRVGGKGKLPDRKLNPEILIFDVDGVLVDVKRTYWKSGLETVTHLTGKRTTWAEFHAWKRQPGNNDDWTLVSRWATSLGVPTSYEQAREAYQAFYWGTNGNLGNVRNEKMLITGRLLEKWGKGRELNLFTGRTRNEFSYTFDRWPAAKHFRKVVTMDDVKRKKPFPDGLHAILGKRDPKKALYVGDNIDDALAAKAARVAFVAILPKEAPDYRQRAKQFRDLGAIKLLESLRELDKLLA